MSKEFLGFLYAALRSKTLVGLLDLLLVQPDVLTHVKMDLELVLLLLTYLTEPLLLYYLSYWQELRP